MNGGAALAIMTADTLAGQDHRPALAFVVGVVAALFSGLCSWRESQDFSAFFFIESTKKAHRTVFADQQAIIRHVRGLWYRKLARWTNNVSLVALIFGCGWASYALTNPA